MSKRSETNSYNIHIGCKEYIITCTECGKDTVEYCHRLTTAVSIFREKGWSIGKRTLCPDCKNNDKDKDCQDWLVWLPWSIATGSKPVTERPTNEQNEKEVD